MSRAFSPPICPTWNTECDILFGTICFSHVQFALRKTIYPQSGTQLEDFGRNEMEKSGGNQRERREEEDIAGILFIWVSFRLI